MAEKPGVEQIVERAVSAALEHQLPQLREQLVRHVLSEVQPLLDNSSGTSESGASDLLKAISAIHAGTTQKEILRALLEGTGRYSGRAALFVVKSGSATGWQGHAFDNKDDIKDFALDMTSPAPAQVMETRAAITVAASEMDPRFISQFGAPAEDRLLLLPLRLKDKIAALVYADAGTDSSGKMDTAAVEVLVAATSAWLEVASLRKQAAKEGPAEGAAESAPVPVQTVSSFSDPFAAHAPKHVAEPPAEVEQPAMAVAHAEPEPVVSVAAASAAAAAVAPAPDSFAQMSVEDAEVHRKAQRFARLLMDEVKLYNQAKVAEGRKNKDLYDRLKDDIEKSRATYMKRYGNTVAATADYINTELIRSLAEDDVSLLGPNFRH
jgi:hypothetical protein